MIAVRRIQTIALRVDIARATALGEDDAIVEDMIEISRLANDEERWPDAQSYSREAEQKAKTLGNASLRARANFQLGLALIGIGDYAEALAQFESALSELRRSHDSRPLVAGLINMGLVNDRLGRPREAEAVWQEAVTVAQSSGDRSRLCMALIDLGSLYFGERQYGAASEHWSRALSLARELKDTVRTAKVTYCLGAMALRENRFTQAEQLLTESRTLHQQLGRPDLASLAEEQLVSLRKDHAF